MKGGEAVTESVPNAPDDRAAPLGDAEAREEMILHLERDQLVRETARPMSRAALSKRVTRALWLLRVFVMIVGAMVLYTFFAHLR